MIKQLLRRGPEIVIGMAGLLAISLVGCMFYVRGCGPGGGERVFAQVATPSPKATYRHDGPALLNDLEVTPGGIGTLTAAQVCSKDFHTGDVRDVPKSTKYAVCEAYGIDRAHCVGLQPDGSGYEIDHLISLELGGNNEPENLWPQPYRPYPAAKEKDLVENELHKQVCDGKIDLGKAQSAIAQDWYKVLIGLPGDPPPDPDPLLSTAR